LTGKQVPTQPEQSHVGVATDIRKGRNRLVNSLPRPTCPRSLRLKCTTDFQHEAELARRGRKTLRARLKRQPERHLQQRWSIHLFAHMLFAANTLKCNPRLEMELSYNARRASTRPLHSRAPPIHQRHPIRLEIQQPRHVSAVCVCRLHKLRGHAVGHVHGRMHITVAVHWFPSHRHGHVFGPLDLPSIESISRDSLDPRDNGRRR
jgi:hypothetical protein